MWHSPSHTSPVTLLAASPAVDSELYAVGYHDGSVRLWSFPSSSAGGASSGVQREAIEVVTFNGHKKAVTALGWDQDGSRLASGGSEGEIVVWDAGEERGIVR